MESAFTEERMELLEDTARILDLISTLGTFRQPESSIPVPKKIGQVGRVGSNVLPMRRPHTPSANAAPLPLLPSALTIDASSPEQSIVNALGIPESILAPNWNILTLLRANGLIRFTNVLSHLVDVEWQEPQQSTTAIFEMTGHLLRVVMRLVALDVHLSQLRNVRERGALSWPGVGDVPSLARTVLGCLNPNMIRGGNQTVSDVLLSLCWKGNGKDAEE